MVIYNSNFWTLQLHGADLNFEMKRPTVDLKFPKKLTLLATATTGGGSELENRYGLDFCRKTLINSLGPVVYPPEAPPSAFPSVELMTSTFPII